MGKNILFAREKRERTLKRKEIFKNHLTKNFDGAEVLKNIYQIIDLLLKRGADRKLFEPILPDVKKTLENLENQMGYAAQYAGYKVPENIQILRKIVNLLEGSTTASTGWFGGLLGGKSGKEEQK